LEKLLSFGRQLFERPRGNSLGKNYDAIHVRVEPTRMLPKNLPKPPLLGVSGGFATDFFRGGNTYKSGPGEKNESAGAGKRTGRRKNPLASLEDLFETGLVWTL
jgi:hypothetical protein